MPNPLGMPFLRSHPRIPTAEEQLLTDCVSAEAIGQPLLASTVKADVSWPSFVVTAVRHGVAQPVAHALLESPQVMPQEVRVVLERLIRANRTRNEAIYRETESVLGALEAIGVEALVLKGVALSLTVYPDPSLRNFADIDVLVREDALDRAHACLMAGGWSLQDGEREPGHHHAVYERHLDTDILTETLVPEYDPSLTPARLAPHTHRIRLEVHQSPFFDISGQAVPFDLEPFWADPETIPFPGGTSFRCPSPASMLVHLSAHAASHGFYKAQFPLDVALLLRAYGSRLRSAHVAELSRHYASTAHVRRMLTFVSAHFESGQAAAIVEVIQPDRGRPLTWPGIFAALDAGKTDNRLQQWLLAGSFREKARGTFRTVAPTPAAMRRIYGVSHPAILVSLYIWRPVQLSGRLFRILLRRFLGPPRESRKDYPCTGSEPS